jgi:biotin carboxyl carrier protein
MLEGQTLWMDAQLLILLDNGIVLHHLGPQQVVRTSCAVEVGGSDVSPEYKVTMDDRPFKVDVKMLDEGGLLVISVGDQSYTMKPTQDDEGNWVVNDTAMDYAVKILKKSGKSVTIEINGEERTFEWERVRKQEAVQTTIGAAATGPKVVGGVYPPMPGKITELRVKVGDSVKAGDTVCILEAMKMFNELKSGSSGSVKEVNVEVGSMVTPNDLLVLIE